MTIYTPAAKPQLWKDAVLDYRSSIRNTRTGTFMYKSKLSDCVTVDTVLENGKAEDILTERDKDGAFLRSVIIQRPQSEIEELLVTLPQAWDRQFDE